jgi:hypothetical protein
MEGVFLLSAMSVALVTHPVSIDTEDVRERCAQDLHLHLHQQEIN